MLMPNSKHSILPQAAFQNSSICAFSTRTVHGKPSFQDLLLVKTSLEKFLLHTISYLPSKMSTFRRHCLRRRWGKKSFAGTNIKSDWLVICLTTDPPVCQRFPRESAFFSGGERYFTLVSTIHTQTLKPWNRTPGENPLRPYDPYHGHHPRPCNPA